MRDSYEGIIMMKDKEKFKIQPITNKNREKVKIKIQRAYLKIKNARKHLIHDLTNKLISYFIIIWIFQ